MSAYAAIEAAALTVLRAYQSGATFTAANSSRGDYGVLEAPGDNAAVIQQMAPTEAGDRLDGRGAHGRRQWRYTLAITLFRKRGTGQGGDGAAYTDLISLTDGVVAHLLRYPRLGSASGVKRAQVTRVSTPMGADGRPHLWQTITVMVDAESEIAYVEDAQ